MHVRHFSYQAGRASALGLAILGAGAWGGCSKTTDDTQVGVLGKASFTYQCGTAEDPYCDTIGGPSTTDFPPLLLGGTSQVQAQDTHNNAVELVSASDGRLAVAATPTSGVQSVYAVDATAPGVTSLVALTADGADYVDLTVSAPAALGLTEVTVGADGKFSGTLGPISGSFSFSDKQVYLRAAPLDAAGHELGGTSPVAYAWATSDPSVVSFASSTSSHIVQIAEGSAGTATVTVQLGASSASFTVTVGS
jgi:hypothetical protein